MAMGLGTLKETGCLVSARWRLYSPMQYKCTASCPAIRRTSLAIPESQLQTWAAFVPSAISKDTADSIRTTLKAMESLRSRDFNVYLQGSYKNDTNLRGDSDVDVVVELGSIFSSNAASLPADQYQRYHQSFPDATYTLADFRREVIDSLCNRYTPQKVDISGNKAIRVLGNPGTRLDADLLVCMEYRTYQSFYGPTSPYVPGVRFYTQREHREVINYPNVHYDNGCKKHASTRDWFKRTVRTYKRARNKVVEKGWMQADIAPSYFVECLLSNVPDHRFGVTYQENFYDVLVWLEGQDLSWFWCQNKQVPLFGNTPEQWRIENAQRFVQEMRDLWRLWS